MENPKETWEECERKLQEVISNHLEIEHDVEIERCHRMGKRKGNRPRTIVCNFLRFKEKQKILQTAKKLNDTEYMYLKTFPMKPWRYESRFGRKY